MFCCVTTAPQHQTLSVRFCVPFTGRVAGYATSRLLQRNTRRLPASQLSRLRCSMPPPDWYIYVTPILRDLHWLRSPERIDFKLTVLTYRWLHGLAPRYLSDYIQSVAVSNRRRLQSLSSSQLVIRRTRLSTVSDRAFPLPDAASGTVCARRRLSFNADCFSKPPQNISFPGHFLFYVFGF